VRIEERSGCSTLALAQLVIYDLHVGTFTPQGTLGAVISHLDDLRDLGFTAIELMPLAQCPGQRNWDYDGVYSFASGDLFFDLRRVGRAGAADEPHASVHVMHGLQSAQRVLFLTHQALAPFRVPVAQSKGERQRTGE